MYLLTARKLNDYLNNLVINEEDYSGLNLDDGREDKFYVNPLTGRTVSVMELNGLLLQQDSQDTYTVYDNGAIWDPIEKRTTGDHYATSHYVLMCAALFRITGETKYLARAEASMPFCFRTLKGYPRVPWGMHYDFNNYALTLTLHLLRPHLEHNQWQKYFSLLRNAKMNRNRTINWAAQRVLYCENMLNLDSNRLSWRHVFMSWLYRRHFSDGIAGDGSYEDHPGRSRPIQYHAFSLALDILIHFFRPQTSNRQRLAAGLKYLTHFIAPDGDFNFFGRGHRQIFAYSPALFAFESFSDSNINFMMKK
jgi:hypothetical protein